MADWKKRKKNLADVAGDWARDARADLTRERQLRKLGLPSKVANANPRRDVLADEAIFDRIKEALGLELAVRLGAGRRPAVNEGDSLYRWFPELQDDKDVELSQSGRIVREIWVPAWEHTGEKLKALAMSAVLSNGPHATLNLNLGEEVVDAALRSTRGFVGYLTDRITRQLKLAFGDKAPRYFFVVEATPLHPFHLHGVIELPNVTDARQQVRKALESAGGEWTTEAPERQAHTSAVWNAPGWVNYIAKATLLTARELRDERLRRHIPQPKRASGVIGGSQTLRRDAAAWYRSVRGSRAEIS